MSDSIFYAQTKINPELNNSCHKTRQAVRTMVDKTLFIYDYDET